MRVPVAHLIGLTTFSASLSVLVPASRHYEKCSDSAVHSAAPARDGQSLLDPRLCLKRNESEDEREAMRGERSSIVAARILKSSLQNGLSRWARDYRGAPSQGATKPCFSLLQKRIALFVKGRNQEFRSISPLPLNSLMHREREVEIESLVDRGNATSFGEVDRICKPKTGRHWIIYRGHR